MSPLRSLALILSAFLCVLCGSIALAADPQVDRGEVVRWGDTVQHIAGDERGGDVGDVMGVPADDNHKWFISVLGSKGCGACARLRADIKADQQAQKHLGAFITLLSDDEMHSDTKTSWSHYNYFLADDKSQAFRFEALKVKAYPMIVVQPPLNKKFGDPATVVFKREGYDGNGAKLAKDISAAIKLYVAKQQERKASGAFKAVLPPPARAELAAAFGQSVDDKNWGVDPPWQPAPKVDPTPAPGPDSILPPSFDIPPITPPTVAPTVTPANDPKGDGAPEAIVVVDKNAPQAEKERRLRAIADMLLAQGRVLRVRPADYRDVPLLDIQRDQLPAVVVTAEGRVLDRITDRLLPVVSPEPTAPRAISFADVPWDVILGLFLGGGITVPGAIAIGLFAMKAVRAWRAAQGKVPLLPFDLDDLAARVAAIVQQRQAKE